MFRCNVIGFLFVSAFSGPGFSRAADAPATAPTTSPGVTLAEGKFHLTPPPSDTWEGVKQAGQGVIVYVTRKHDAVMAIQLQPPDVEITPEFTEEVVKQLKESNVKKKVKMLLEPAVESDERFALKVHERYEKGTKTADQMHLYRYVGRRLMMVMVDSVAEAPDDVKAAQTAAEDVLLSATGPGMKNMKRPASRPARLK